jgi:hypothetical protein
MFSGALSVTANYSIANRGTFIAQYRYDPVTGAVTRFGP